MTYPQPLRADAHRVLSGWVPEEPGQDDLRQLYLEHLAGHDDAMFRSCRVGHLTASALVVDESREHVLLTLHPKVGRWLQMGGHCEPEDASLQEAAAREAREESGIVTGAISALPLRLDRHAVPCGGERSVHLDVQYLMVVADGSEAVISDESDDLRWFAVDALPDGLDGSVRALIGVALANGS